jgi:hypothetical protein
MTCWCGCKLDGSEATEYVVFVLEVQFEKSDVSIGERLMELRHGRCHAEVGVDEDTLSLTARRKLGCTL